MSTFLMLAALLALIALSFIVPPLLTRPAPAPAQHDALNLTVLRDQLRELDGDLAIGAIEAGAYRSARAELERRVIEDVRPEQPAPVTGAGLRWQAGAIALAVLLGAGTLYVFLGNPRAIRPADAVSAQAPPTRQQAEAMVRRLTEHLSSAPADAQGWRLLARWYTAMQRYAEAGQAYAQLLALVPGDASVLTSYADVLAVAQGKSLQGQPEQLLKRALERDPHNVKALLLFGSAQFERMDYLAAIATWEKIAAQAGVDADTARLVSDNIADARARLERQDGKSWRP